MTDAPRRLLPFLKTPGHSGPNRDSATCRYRCGNACDHDAPNTTDNEYLGDVIATAVSRRGLLKAGAASVVVAAAAGAGSVALASPAAATGHSGGPSAPSPSSSTGELSFLPVAPNLVDSIVVPSGYDWSPLVAWGEPILPGAPDFDFDNLTERAQLGQFGYNCDFVGILPINRDKALLAVNHEYTNPELMFRGWNAAAPTLDQLKVMMAATGMSVVLIERVDRTGEWELSRDKRRYNRRIHTGSRMELTGPAAGHPLLKTSRDSTGRKVFGTLNNCAGGVTPWGTVLSGEENWNFYFSRSVAPTDATEIARSARYGLPTAVSNGSFYQNVDARFDLSVEPNEAHRFGYIVEIDPFDPDSTPKKRTALGRFKHEGANVIIADDGRVVAYSGDDERFDYFYKFVSKKKFRSGSSRSARENNMSLLDEGDLYVAKLTGDSPPAEITGTGAIPADGAFDGSGVWLPLVLNGQSMVPDMTVAEVLIFTRLAADKVGPTKMDRPEDIEPNPLTGKVYVALTNNTQRGTAGRAPVDEPNPRIANKDGHVLELTEAGGDSTATTFGWNLFIVAGSPTDPSTYFAGYDKSKVSPISCPDNVAFDPWGNLWISTDGNTLGANDGLFAVPLEGPERGHVKQFASVPRAAECCGPWITEDGRTALLAVQHPGEVTGANPDNPVSRFPYGDQPRPAVVTIWRKYGGWRIGS